ncbi:hypothetical protein [Sphingobium yanoikuyae]|jgi:hypothetical protein|uniref:Lipoprotein n=1 Tax=Sphingobium yanoikuyae TaxID=13690 RepID=A0A430BQ03_SPHYA|nr:hypothetical protein [Sphingobium yanoikuyae]RSU54750.1 hypothetical protein DAH51_19535 [Sphingobium yanoikuyae]
MMKRLLISTCLLGLASCDRAGLDRQAMLAAQIEKQVKLPEGAAKLSDYGRNYAFKEAGIVTGIYLIPIGKEERNEGCEVMLANMASRPCSAQEMAGISDMQRAIDDGQAKAGESRWFASEKELPYINDGGCSQVSLEYDVQQKRVVTIGCNGEA